MQSQLTLIEVASELGAGTRGSSLGPMAIRRACLDHDQHPIFTIPRIKVQHENELLHEPDDYPNAHRIHGISRMWSKISEKVEHTIKANNTALVIAGDHSNAGGTISGIKAAYPNERVGIVWIDAHADVHSPYTTPSGNVHGMPLSAVLGDDNLECKRNDPNEVTVENWEQMKSIASSNGQVNPQDIFFLGIRDLEQQEIDYLSRLGISSMLVDEVRDLGAEETVKKVMQYFTGIDRLYISFDVDSLDPEISRGTGTPVPHGFTKNEGLDMIMNFIKQDQFSCLEITEVNPLLDTENKMAKLVASYLTSIIPAMQAQMNMSHA